VRQGAARTDFGNEASRVKRFQPLDKVHLFLTKAVIEKIFVEPLEAKKTAS
jgi:hypothetical protein